MRGREEEEKREVEMGEREREESVEKRWERIGEESMRERKVEMLRIKLDNIVYGRRS